jgi:biotin carboxyl carrier protein
MKYQTTVNGKKFDIEINQDGEVFLNGEKREVDFVSLGETLYSVITDAESHEVLVDDKPGTEFDVQMRGRLYTVGVLDERALLLASRRGSEYSDSGEVSIKAPMPGLVVLVPVAEGDEVEKGQTLVVLESMKMQNELKAPRNGVVQRVGVQPGQSVEQNKVLVTIT